MTRGIRGRPWTPAEEAEMIRLRDVENASNQAIADTIGRAKWQVEDRIGQLIRAGQLTMRRRPSGSPWTPERDAELRRRWEAGETGGQIGRAMGLTKDAVIGRARRLELPLRPSPIKPRAEKAPPHDALALPSGPIFRLGRAA